MTIAEPKHIFDAVRVLTGPLSPKDVDLINQAIRAACGEVSKTTLSKKTGGMDVSPAGIEALHKREGCRLTAYPDPGSRDGNPWTIGYGSTGPDIVKGTVWTQQQADQRFEQDLRRFEDQVEAVLDGTPTNQAQFDALVSLAYNIGVANFRKSTLLRRHIEQKYDAAAQEFARWVFNDGKKMAGLINRRASEARQYLGSAA